MKKTRAVRLYVAPEFKSYIKSEAARDESTLLEFTKKIAIQKGIAEEDYKIKHEKKPFTFRL